MQTLRLPGRRGDGSAAVRGWVALYTLGLPRVVRTRRRDEINADLADETLDSVRRGRQQTLFGQRMRRLVRGVPSDLAWRVIDAPTMAREFAVSNDWPPPTRWSMALIGMSAIGNAGALAIVTLPVLLGGAGPDTWSGWGPVGFTIGSAGIFVGVLIAIPRPGRGAALVVPSAVVGFLAAPWLWGGWLLAIITVAVRSYVARSADAADVERLDPRRPR